MTNKPPIFSRERLIRFSDCDPAGIVFYPQYFVMFNGLVEDWFNDGLGVGYQQTIIARRTGLPTVRLEADFKTVSKMGEMVMLTLDVERLGSKSITLQLNCIGKVDDTLKMTIRQVMVTTSLLTHQSIDVPDNIRDAICTALDRQKAIENT
jgi:4-hydroxybenzoyl-CoA thioesterase